MNRSSVVSRNLSGSISYRKLDHRTLSITLLGTNNQTLEGTVNLTSMIIGSAADEEDYDATGAAYYVCAVILVYGLSIVLLIGSLAKKKMGDKGQEKEEKQINSYLHQASDLRDKSERDNYRQLKQNIITLVSNTTPASTPSISAKGTPSLTSPDSPRKTVGSLETLLEEHSRQASVEKDTDPPKTDLTSPKSGRFPDGNEQTRAGKGARQIPTEQRPSLGQLHGDVWSMQVDADEPPRGTSSPDRFNQKLAPPSHPGKAVAVDRSPSIPRVNKYHAGWPNPFTDEVNPNKSLMRDKSPSRERNQRTPASEPMRAEPEVKQSQPIAHVRATSRSPDRSGSPIQRGSRPPKLQIFPERRPSPAREDTRDRVRLMEPVSQPPVVDVRRPRPQRAETRSSRGHDPLNHHPEPLKVTANEGAPPKRRSHSPPKARVSDVPNITYPARRSPGPSSNRGQVLGHMSRDRDRRSRSPQPSYLSPYADSTPAERPRSYQEPQDHLHPQRYSPAGREERDESPGRQQLKQPYSGRHGQWSKNRRSPSPGSPLLREPSPCPSETEELLQVTCV